MASGARDLARSSQRTSPLTAHGFFDTAGFSVVVGGTVTIPVIFSIAHDDVFALPKMALTASLASLLAVLLVGHWLAGGRPMRRPTWLAIALGSFAGWNLLAAWFAIDSWHALVGEAYQYQGLVASLAYGTFLIGAWSTVRTESRRGILLVGVAASAVVVATYALLQRMGLDPIWSTLPRDRVFSTIGQANALAAYLVLVAPLVVVLAIRRGWRWRLAGLLALIVSALAFTLSRGGFLGLATVAIVLVLGAWRVRPHMSLSGRWLAASALIAIGAVVTAASVPEMRAVVERVGARALLTADLSEGSTRMHLDQWAVGAAIVADHPVLGTGQDTYVLMFDEYRDRVLAPDRAALLSYFRPESPHNVYLATAAGAGLPALIAYLSVIGLVMARAAHFLRAEVPAPARLFAAACLAAIAGHLVTDAFLTAETSGSVLFWIALGAGAALEAHAPRDVRRE